MTFHHPVRHAFARRYLPWLLAAACCSALPAVAAPPGEEALTLEAAVRQAASQAPLLAAGRDRANAAREETARAGALPDPQLTFGMDNVAVQGPGAYTAGGDSMTMRSVGVSQALPSRSLRRAERSAAEARVEQADASTQAVDLSIRQQAAQAWVTAWGAAVESRMLEALRDEWALDLAAARAHLRGGAGSAGDVLAVRGQALELENQLDEAQAREATARAELARWLGAPADRPLAEPPDFDRLPQDEPVLLARLDEQGSLLDWPARERAAEAALAEAQAAKQPQWTVGASYGSRVRGLSDMVSVQVGVSLPLFTRNRQDRGISARAADLDAVRAERLDAYRAQAAAVQAAWARWRAMGRQLRRHRDELLPLTEDRVRLALAAYRGGGDLQPLLEARRDELTRYLDYARMRADYGRAWAVLAYLLPAAPTVQASRP